VVDAGATTLGLQGEASVAGFQAMFEGRDPITGELLGRPHGRNAVPAFDVVLRPTKSVSVLYGLGDPATGRAVLQAHHAGLAEAVGYLDEHIGARRGHGGVQHVSGQGLLAVGFDHRTSREGDPLLHTHLVIANRVAGVGRTELEALADRFLAERAVSVVADRTLDERRWSTPELLAVEQRLVAAAVGRTGEQKARVSHEAVRGALAAHPTAGADQQAMVRDVCQGGQGVGVVVGRAGTGKTFALGIARHAWQLDGYRLLAAAPTGIASMSLQGEGFEDVATCDRLLGDLHRGTEQLNARTVLVVDEAGMLGSRKLTRLLEHAQQAEAKVVLVGDDRQLAAIDAGGGFRALRLRLGASELVENRRQQQAWEREALELVRGGLVEEAVAAYRAHDRVVAADSKPAATLVLLQDWWAVQQEAEEDPAREVIVLAARRAEVDRLNTACQELLAARGRLGSERLQVEDRQLAVGDRVVCGRNAIAELGVANGSRGTITALDPHARTLTIRLDGADDRTVTLPRSYLDGRGRGERNRRVDLAYVTTGHRAQGLTRGRPWSGSPAART
jgi:AAA domain/TrwC relaxase